MEIESMVANSALIRAREGGGGKGRSDKWKEMLRLPHISQCVDVAVSLDRNYWSLCVKQPIGKRLFQLFCRSQLSLKNYVSLQDALEVFETRSDEERAKFGLNIVDRFFRSQSLQLVPIMEPHELNCIHSLEVDPCTDIFLHCRKDLHQYLSAEPFLQYQDSMFFDRFLQWKMLERQAVTKQNFRQYRLLGKGGFGEVWACQVRATGMMYACKKLEKTHVKRRRGENMALNEKEILESLDSRFVVNLAYAYETKHDLCMVLTMMSGGDLRFHIYSIGNPGLDKERVRFYAAEVCCGLMHLHQKSIVYRDLKPENILVDDKGHIRISDLGLAVRLREGQLVKGRVGTLGYMAPEVIGHNHYGTSADWWGLGCLIYEMTAGQPPLRSKGEHPKPAEMERRIQTEKEDYGTEFKLDVRDICSRLMKKDSQRRLGCGAAAGMEVQSHRFFNKINFRMLEAGLVEPPFKPDPKLVYCNDVQDIEEFLPVKGVTLDQTDLDFYTQFNTGSVPITWQNEIIDTGCFRELNVFGSKGTRTADLDWTQVPEKRTQKSLLDRIFRRHHQNSPESSEDEPSLPNSTYLGAGLISSTF